MRYIQLCKKLIDVTYLNRLKGKGANINYSSHYNNDYYNYWYKRITNALQSYFLCSMSNPCCLGLGVIKLLELDTQALSENISILITHSPLRICHRATEVNESIYLCYYY